LTKSSIAAAPIAQMGHAGEVCGVNPDEGIAMWVADSDFRTAPPIIEALQGMVDHGVFGYGFDDQGYRDAVCWWQSTHHGWSVDPDWIVTTQGLATPSPWCCKPLPNPGEARVSSRRSTMNSASRRNARRTASVRDPHGARRGSLCPGFRRGGGRWTIREGS
jgi:bifunctional pyridoxal-dependent enzyme with beta-cystathionase and maltose regulon repressor activities